MRQATDKGPCAQCGRTTGLFWKPSPVVLDFGVPGVAPREPKMNDVTLCDECNDRRRLVELRKAGYA